MKTPGIAVALWMGMMAVGAAEEPTIVTYAELKANAESLQNKLVSFTAPYVRFNANFARYMEKSGLSPSRYFWLHVDDGQVAVMLRRTDERVNFVTALQKDSVLRVVGKVRQFRAPPRPRAGEARLPVYYVEAEALEVVAEDVSRPNRAPGRRPAAP